MNEIYRVHVCIQCYEKMVNLESKKSGAQSDCLCIFRKKGFWHSVQEMLGNKSIQQSTKLDPF